MVNHTKIVHVAVGVIQDSRGRILIAKRHAAQHMGGLWEFPGGKVEADETVQQALHRELAEELAIEILQQRPLCLIEHHYADKSVLLDVWLIEQFSGNPHGQEGQPLRWVSPGKLVPADFPAGNRAIIRVLQLPAAIALLNTTLDCTLPALPDQTLLRLRRTQDVTNPQHYRDRLLHILSRLPPEQGVIVDWDSDSSLNHSTLLQHPQLRGYHLNRHQLMALQQRPDLAGDHLLLGCSCHNLEELEKAAQLQADYVIISPVLPTRSHPGAEGLGWKRFADLVARTRIPVYAMGGLTWSDLPTARAAGARGIAGISMFCD